MESGVRDHVRAAPNHQVCRLLTSGANVVTTRGGFHHPDSLDPGVRSRVEEACRFGGTSIHSTGSSPGFITEAVPLVPASIQRRLGGLVIDEFADLSRRDSPELLFDVMGFGKPPAELDERRLAHGKTSFGPSLRARDRLAPFRRRGRATRHRHPLSGASRQVERSGSGVQQPTAVNAVHAVCAAPPPRAAPRSHGVGSGSCTRQGATSPATERRWRPIRHRCSRAHRDPLDGT